MSNEEGNSEKGKKYKKRRKNLSSLPSNNNNNNIIDSRDLLFLRKDNVAYFIDINGKPLDSGPQKLFETNEIPCLGNLALGKVIKYKAFW